MALKKAPAGKPRSAKAGSAKAKRAPTWAQLAARGKGARKLPIVVNRLPKDLIEKIKQRGTIPLANGVYTYSGAGVVTRYWPSIPGNKLPRHMFFDANTGKKLSSAQVMNRMKRKGIASL